MKKGQKSGEWRPTLSGADPLKECAEILNERMPVYERASDYRVDTNGQNPQEVAQAIMSALPHWHKGDLAGGY